MSKFITPDEIEADMVLAEPVKNKFGQVLLSANTKLQEKHKGILKTWGVQTIQIASDGGKDFAKFDESAVTAAKEILSSRMSWQPRNANEKDLAEMALERILESNFQQ